MFEKTAQLLVSNATSSGVDSDDRDAFGRSAFNRYYYSAYLQTREMLKSIQHGWHGVNHADVPRVLTGEISKELKKARTRANRMKDWETKQSLDRGIDAARTLSDLMKVAYSTRGAADYHPEFRVEFSSGCLQLVSVSIDQAKSWPYKAKQLSTEILRAWKLSSAS
ncbi:hypothetical protein GYB61_05860 [bacterium]|nr:hypothetical protein [bacterium]